ncbi:HD domain-containing protein [Paenibacillus thalictri]|uniref:bis(5'-nucleosyl)-tetraphosphatase (symmetrical) n=2 Tax=Paenibacillus thalictri TaxID=2527873 RepID=A0A4Q9DUK5_9BACL|nr:HD domain-containing protein [Paenibacillus thalictri]
MIARFRPSGNMAQDVQQFLKLHHCPRTAEHSVRVAVVAAQLASRFGGVDPLDAADAGYLHDISAVVPIPERIRVARELALDVLPEEEAFPLIVHQKISETMASVLFGVSSRSVLSAIGCHTTLKASASRLDMIVFVADKIEWDQAGTPPYITRLTQALDISLEHGAFSYLEYMWEQRDRLKVVHPWLKEAYFELKRKIQDADADVNRDQDRDR